MGNAFLKNWRLYVIEAWALGMFMISATFFVVLLYHPFFSFNKNIADPITKRLLVGLAMGLTAMGIINSGWGVQSGAHMNPAVSLAQLQLGRMASADTFWYIIFQTFGAAASMLLGELLFHHLLIYPDVNYIVTKPGSGRVWVAFWAEAGLSFFLFTTLLFVSNSQYRKFTSLAAAILICMFITLESPVSGMSINPARSFGSAIAADQWQSFWIYILAPIGGMQLAALVFRLAAFRLRAVQPPQSDFQTSERFD
jgi:aquaporin Z